MLHITNGDCAAGGLREAGIAGEILPWRDALHDGPVPADLTLEQMSTVRAQFIADCGWGEYNQVLEDFEDRDAKLGRASEHEEIILWFEHDLYDQLQLLQLLDWFSRRRPQGTQVTLVCKNEYLGEAASERITALFETRTAVTADQLTLASEGWAAFSSPDPERLLAFITKDTSALPYLKPASTRFLEEYPSVENGLSRNERQILQIVGSGITGPAEMFQRSQEMEEARYLGDRPFFTYLNKLVEADQPLLKSEDKRRVTSSSDSHSTHHRGERSVVLTDAGRDVLDDKLDWVRLNRIDRWLGGVHLRAGNIWRWDARKARVVKTDN